ARAARGGEDAEPEAPVEAGVLDMIFRPPEWSRGQARQLSHSGGKARFGRTWAAVAWPDAGSARLRPPAVGQGRVAAVATRAAFRAAQARAGLAAWPEPCIGSAQRADRRTCA